MNGFYHQGGIVGTHLYGWDEACTVPHQISTAFLREPIRLGFTAIPGEHLCVGRLRSLQVPVNQGD